MNAIDTISQVMSQYGDEWENIGYTPYAVAQIINDTFVELGSDKSIRPQMMYNYARNGLINGVKGSKLYTAEEVGAFVIRYVSKHI